MKKKVFLHHIKEIIFFVAAWMLLTVFYVYIKFGDMETINLRHFYPNMGTYSKSYLYEIALLSSFQISIALGILYSFVYPVIWRKWSALAGCLVRFGIFCLLTTWIFFIVPIIEVDILGRKASSINPAVFKSIFIYMMAMENMMAIFCMLRRSLGPRYFRNMLSSTYRKPKEELRVFLFLDLENSTPAAAYMGHIKYSKYIQDCFYDLSDIVIANNGSIYQFVGDEAVITWMVKADFDYEKCVALYFDYMDVLQHKQPFYSKKYGQVPHFRCAVDIGVVSAVMVGDYTQQIGYHGNTLNLCARLQSVAKELQANILVSQAFSNHLKANGKYVQEQIIIPHLKGIPDAQLVYRISQVL